MMRGGLGGLLAIIALLYFTDAGNWLWTRIETLDSDCYQALGRVDPAIANPVCGGVAVAIEAIGSWSEKIGDTTHAWRQRLLDEDDLRDLESVEAIFERRAARLASSKEELAQMINAGPQAASSGSIRQQFQQAIDNFTISQIFLKDGASTSQAIPWLQQGATQPEGFGVMAQIALGNLYAQGGNGVPQNPQAAQQYLEQAKNSITILSSSNTPQAQQLLSSLPMSPVLMKEELDRAIRQLQLGK